MSDNNNAIKPIAVPGIHDKFYIYLLNNIKHLDNPSILDIGAGHGYLVKKLHEDGYNVAAADIYPEYYYYTKVPCIKADITKKLPFENNSFNVIIAVEVMEHISDHEMFFNEAYRILKKNGLLFFTTPNILSLKSRVRFLFSGFFYAFSPIDHSNHNGLQHIASISLDQYQYLIHKAGFEKTEIKFDKRQSSSIWLSFLIPFIRLYCKLKSIPYHIHNKYDYLTGRVIFMKALKNKER